MPLMPTLWLYHRPLLTDMELAVAINLVGMTGCLSQRAIPTLYGDVDGIESTQYHHPTVLLYVSFYPATTEDTPLGPGDLPVFPPGIFSGHVSFTKRER